MKKKFIILILLFSLAALMGLKIKIDKISRKKIPGSSVIYLPSGKYLRFAAFGYSSLLADLIYIWSIQYYSDYSAADRFKYLDHIFSVIAELDHRYLDPYQTGALIALYEAKDFDLAFKILDRGLAKNPEEWIFPFQAGHLAQMVKKDYQLARKYYRKTMGIKGAPPIAKRLYANASFELSDYKTAWNTWLEVYETADDQRIKKIASNHLYRVKAAIDIQTIQEAIEQFRESYGRNPEELSLLVKGGFLPSLPKDLDGQDYLYDFQSGEVKTQTIPWKR